MVKSKIMQIKITGICLLTLISCGTSDKNEDGEASSETEIIENSIDSAIEETSSLELDEYQPSQWQIDDYAEFFEDDCIEDKFEDIDWNDPNEECHSYYQTKDLKGGFVSITGAMEGWIEYVVFRMADGRDLVCRMAVDCGPACGYDYKFYYCNSEFNKEAGAELFPYEEMKTHQEVMYQKGLEKFGDFEYSEDQQLRYIFPQKGTSMDVHLILGADDIEYPIMKLGWNKTNFFVEDLYHEIKSI